MATTFAMPPVFAPGGSNHRRGMSSAKRVSKRLSLQLSEQLPILPYTAAEWTKTVADVKREYLNRRYRPCANRCSEILDNVRDPSTMEPTYLIYLNFYAASAMEMLARSLHHSSPARIALIQQAREHYLQASQLIQTADRAIVAHPPSSASLMRQRRPPSGCPTLQHSPTSSISSVASSRISPTSSISSLQDARRVPKRSTSKRSVAAAGPIVRPDSPTLGFDDCFGPSSPDLISAMPLPPSAAPSPFTLPSAVINSSNMDREEAAAAATEEDEVTTHDPFLRERAIHRYRTILTCLQRQVARHLSFINEDLASSRTVPPPSNDELRALELQTRIERLRGKGWQRPRFNAQRYQTLCETAMADMLE